MTTVILEEVSEELNQKNILDNYWGARVSDYLRSHLPGSDTFRLVSAYFSIFGFQVLQKELEHVNDVRFLFGNPSSVGELDPSPKGEKSFNLTEEGLTLNHVLRQRNLARKCEEWVQKDSVQIKSIKIPNFLHGKMYLTEKPNNSAAIVGSSNFTLRGLGGAQNANVEINLATNKSDIYKELQIWFDNLWNNQGLTEDVKDDVLVALRRVGEDYSPEEIYYKTLFELFHEELDRRAIGEDYLQDTHFFDTKIWNALYKFQRDGAKSVIARLEHLNGCVLADSVGLGKTFTALAVIKFFELKNQRVLVLCPKRLRENWAVYPSYHNQSNNPFLEDRFSFTLLSHTDLTRTRGNEGGINLENFNWSSFDLVVIDESHNFRTGTKSVLDDEGNIVKTSRYSRLMDEVIKAGPKTKVLMLSATPVNISLLDLRNQIYLATEGRDEEFRSKLGVGNIGNIIIQAQKKFKDWENHQYEDGKRNKTELLDKLGPDFFQLLDGISIARSKKHIQKYYENELEKIGQFPKVPSPINYAPNTDNLNSLSYEELANQINNFSLSIYQPSKYLVEGREKQRLDEEKQRLQFNQLDRENALLGIIRTNFLKRLESSAYSLTKTLERTIAKIDDLIEKIERFEVREDSPNLYNEILPDDDEDDEEFFVNRDIRNPYHFTHLDLDNWKLDLHKDKVALTSALKQISIVTPSRDGKLLELKQIIRNKINNPTSDLDGKPNRKILIFTTFKDTGEYLYNNLEDLALELKINRAFVSGEYTKTTVGEDNFNSILTNFSPISKNRVGSETSFEIDLLIATDCISEGQNLQDCDMVLNYDIHWNPVRIIQRFGRIDRIGSRNNSVQMINFWPVKDIDIYLRLAPRIAARMALVGTIGSGDDPLNQGEGYVLGNSFRDEQLMKLRNEVIDLDELSDNIVMSDFTLDDFLIQLLKYLENNRQELEKVPLGSYSITEGKEQHSKGVIFVLKRKNSGISKDEKTASPIHPFYITHIDFQGKVSIGCTNARKVLELFHSSTLGQNNALQKLCDWFDVETSQGQEMFKYSNLLKRVVEHIINRNIDTFGAYLGSTLATSFKLPEEVEQNPMNNFELVTWLVIK